MLEVTYLRKLLSIDCQGCKKAGGVAACVDKRNIRFRGSGGCYESPVGYTCMYIHGHGSWATEGIEMTVKGTSEKDSWDFPTASDLSVNDPFM
jgi:hypothetical protein